MTDRTRLTAIWLLALLGAGIVAWLITTVLGNGEIDLQDGGILAAAFLSLREVMSKIEKIALGVRTPAPPSEEEE